MTTEQALRQALEHCLNWLPEDCAAACEARAALVAPAQPAEKDEDGPIREGWTVSYSANGHSGPGIYAHMDEYPEEGAICLQTIEQPAEKDGALSDRQFSAGARALSDQHAASCGVDKEDHWKLYGNVYIEDFRAAYLAAIEAAMQKEQS